MNLLFILNITVLFHQFSYVIYYLLIADVNALLILSRGAGLLNLFAMHDLHWTKNAQLNEMAKGLKLATVNDAPVKLECVNVNASNK